LRGKGTAVFQGILGVSGLECRAADTWPWSDKSGCHPERRAAKRRTCLTCVTGILKGSILLSFYRKGFSFLRLLNLSRVSGKALGGAAVRSGRTDEKWQDLKTKTARFDPIRQSAPREGSEVQKE
jgi:hypothetical protein